MSYALSYSSNTRRALGTSEVLETKASRKFRLYFSERCSVIGETISTKCELGGEIVKICQSDGFHVVKNTCGTIEASDYFGFSRHRLLFSALVILTAAFGF